MISNHALSTAQTSLQKNHFKVRLLRRLQISQLSLAYLNHRLTSGAHQLTLYRQKQERRLVQLKFQLQFLRLQLVLAQLLLVQQLLALSFS